jgi:hypothetical protein
MLLLLLSFLPLLSLSRRASKAIHGAAMTVLLWRALIKPIFLRGIIKMDAYKLSLAIPNLNFTQNKI